jgi:hypothetical protein
MIYQQLNLRAQDRVKDYYHRSGGNGADARDMTAEFVELCRKNNKARPLSL